MDSRTGNEHSGFNFYLYVLGALGCDMSTFIRYFPAVETLYSVFVALAIGIIVLLLPIVFVTIYGGGYVAQFIRNYQEWEAGGNFAGNGTAPAFPSAAVSDCLKSALDFPYNLYGIFLCFLLFGILIFMIMRMGHGGPEIRDTERNFTYSDKGAYGTAGFMTEQEMNKVLKADSNIKTCDGTILGQLNKKIVSVPTDSRMKKNIAVYGASSSMKSRAFARNMIFQCVKRGESVRGGIIIGLGSRLQVFQNKLIRLITSHDEIDLTLPGQEKCAYFCITSDQDSTFDFLSSLFLSFLFIKLVRYADKYGDGGKLPVPVHILADELANIGVIPDLTKKISTIRSRNLSISVIFQNLAQMQNRYPLNQWQEIIGNCDVQLFLGCTDEVTAKFISDRAGKITIGVSSESKQLNTWRVSNYTPEYRETKSIGRRRRSAKGQTNPAHKGERRTGAGRFPGNGYSSRRRNSRGNQKQSGR